jgi:hypothetical protein
MDFMVRTTLNGGVVGILSRAFGIAFSSLLFTPLFTFSFHSYNEWGSKILVLLLESLQSLQDALHMLF